MSGVRMVALLVALVGLASVPASAVAQEALRIFTIAGASSQAAHPCWPIGKERRIGPARHPDDACRSPIRAFESWPASQRHFAGQCLTRLPDGTIVLCHRTYLLGLSKDGLISHWPPSAMRTSIEGLLRDPRYGFSIDDAAAAPDGSVIVVGSGGVARVRPDGTAQQLGGPGVIRSGRSIAALPDGGAVVTGASLSLTGQSPGVHYDLVRLDASGNLVRHVQRLPRNRRVGWGDEGHGVTVPGDVAALPDGSLVLAQTSQHRVLRLDAKADDRVTVLAGGGRGFKDGSRATDVDLGDVWAVARLADDAILIGAERGLLRLDRDGRIHTLVRGGAVACDCAAVDDARAVNDDGRHPRDVRLTKISAVETSDGEQPLVLTEVAGSDLTHRLALIAPIDRIGRLAVALPRDNRTLLRHGRVDILATRRAKARLELLRGRRVLVSRTISLVRGRTRVRLRAPRSTKPHVLRVTATTSQPAVASHQLALIPSRLLTRQVLRYIEDGISVLGADAENDVEVWCRPRTQTRFACVYDPWIGRSSRAVLRVRRDGLITFQRRGRYPLKLVYEPLTFNPRP